MARGSSAASDSRAGSGAGLADAKAARNGGFPWALAASLALHLGLVVTMRARPAEARSVVSLEPPPPVDLWVGSTSLPGLGSPVDVDVDAERAAAAAGPAAAAAPTTPSLERERPRREAKKDPPAGEDQSEDAASPPAPKKAAEPRPPVRPPIAPRTESSSAGAGRSSSGAAAPTGAPGEGGSFGAEGPGGVRDLGRAFTRAIPPASDADPAWRKLAPGDAGEIEVAIEIDDEGHVKGFTPLTKNPPAHLVGMVRRTLAFLQGGTFALKPGSVGAGRQVVALGARVSDVSDDGTPASPDRLRFSYERGRGTAAFTQTGGRHVDVTVRVLRVEASKG